MFDTLRRRVSSAHVMSAIALFVALGGTGYAAVKINGRGKRQDGLARGRCSEEPDDHRRRSSSGTL